jgi:quercetin dioxygenase-like cupin family protein
MRAVLRSLAAAGVAASALYAGAAVAGECPADKVGENLISAGPTQPLHVTDTLLSSIDLAAEPVGVADRQFRIRRLEIQPGGIVPWHSHGDRPALIYVVQGEVTEYASDCAVPIVHRAGEVSTETHVTAHWWRNTGTVPAILVSADLLHSADDEHMM